MLTRFNITFYIVWHTFLLARILDVIDSMTEYDDASPTLAASCHTNTHARVVTYTRMHLLTQLSATNFLKVRLRQALVDIVSSDSMWSPYRLWRVDTWLEYIHVKSRTWRYNEDHERKNSRRLSMMVRTRDVPRDTANAILHRVALLAKCKENEVQNVLAMMDFKY